MLRAILTHQSLQDGHKTRVRIFRIDHLRTLVDNRK